MYCWNMQKSQLRHLRGPMVQLSLMEEPTKFSDIGWLFLFPCEDTAVQYIHTRGMSLRPGMSRAQRINIDVSCLIMCATTTGRQT
jgi:hypothetical protein